MPHVKAIALRLLDSAGGLVSRLYRLQGGDPTDSSSIKRILVLRLDHIGDVVMSTPVLEALSSSYPQAEVHLVCNSAAATLLGAHPRIHQIHSFDWPWPYDSRNNTFTRRTALSYLRLRKQLSAHRFQMMLELRGDIRFHVLFGVLLRIPIRVSSLRTGGRKTLTHCVVDDLEQHEIERTASILSSIGIPKPQLRPYVPVTAENVAAAKAVRASRGGLKKYAIFAPFAAKRVKEWDESRWVQLAREVSSRWRVQVLVSGGPADADACKRIAESAGGNTASIGGEVSLSSLAALLRDAEFGVGVDAGTLHIASAFDVPIVALFGPTRHKQYGPYSPLATIVDHEKCRCDQDKHLKCRFPSTSGALCLDLISVEDVLIAIEAALSKQSSLLPQLPANS